MTDIPLLNNYDDTPIYTIKTVVHETGIAPATLRAWERRYGCLSPGRSEGGYRLYSERDIAILHWLKQQIDAGVSISRAAALLDMRQGSGDWTDQAISRTSVELPSPPEGARATAIIVGDLVEALLAYDETRAEKILNEAFALHAVEIVAEEVVGPALVEIGDRWHRGEASVIQEHFATGFLRRRLTALFNAYAQPASGPLAVTGAGPGEWHDVGILLVSIALRRQGWRVIYLGQNVPVDQYIDQILALHPSAVCLSASTRVSAAALARVHAAVIALPKPRPQLCLGGQAFNSDPELRNSFPGAHVISSTRELFTHLSPLLKPA